MSRLPALAVLALLCTTGTSAQVAKDGAKPAPSLPDSVIPGYDPGRAVDGAARDVAPPPPPGPPSAPAVDGRRLGPSTRGPVEPEPTLEPELLAAPVAVDKALFDKVVTHVRKHCTSEEDGGPCCLSGQSPLKKGAANRTACLDIRVPAEEGDVHLAVYREIFLGLTMISTTVIPKEKRVEHVTLRADMDGSVSKVEISSEGDDGVEQLRANAMKPGETEPLFTEAAKDMLVIAPRVRI
jgi:hypothetical protein